MGFDIKKDYSIKGTKFGTTFYQDGVHYQVGTYLPVIVDEANRKIVPIEEAKEELKAESAPAVVVDTPIKLEPKKGVECDICGKTFKSGHGLYMHRKRVHNIQDDDYAAFRDKR